MTTAKLVLICSVFAAALSTACASSGTFDGRVATDPSAPASPPASAPASPSAAAATPLDAGARVTLSSGEHIAAIFPPAREEVMR